MAPIEIKNVSKLINGIPIIGFNMVGVILCNTSKYIISIWIRYIPKLYLERKDIVFDSLSWKNLLQIKNTDTD